MIDNHKKGLKAIHTLIIESRRLVGYQENEKTFKLLDEVEYLVALLLEEENRTDWFDEYLKGTCTDFNFLNIYSKFKKLQ